MLESFPLGSLFSDSGLSFTVGVSQFAGGGINVSFYGLEVFHLW